MLNKKPFAIPTCHVANLTFATIVGIAVFLAQKDNRKIIIDAFKNLIKSLDEKLNTMETK